MQRHAANWANVKRFAEERGLLTVEPAGAFIIWLRLPAGVDADHFSEHLRVQHETLVVPGTFFGRRDRFRLSFSGDPTMVSEGLRRVGLGLDELAPKSA
jgi:aspartate/methionine/tyrosine aminotransferase